MSISKYVNREVITLSEDASLYDAAKLMKDKNIGALIIVKNKASDQTPVGILTDRDIVFKILDHEMELKKINVQDIYTRDLLTLKEHEGMEETIKAMCDKGVRRAPMIDEQGQLTGIITLDDLIIKLTEKLQHLSELIKKQIN